MSHVTISDVLSSYNLSLYLWPATALEDIYILQFNVLVRKMSYPFAFLVWHPTGHYLQSVVTKVKPEQTYQGGHATLKQHLCFKKFMHARKAEISFELLRFSGVICSVSLCL